MKTKFILGFLFIMITLISFIQEIFKKKIAYTRNIFKKIAYTRNILKKLYAKHQKTFSRSLSYTKK